MILAGLAGCGAASCVGFPTALAPGAADPRCVARAGDVDPQRLRATVAALAGSPRYLDEERATARAWLTQNLTAAGRTVEDRPFDIAGVYGDNLVARGA